MLDFDSRGSGSIPFIATRETVFKFFNRTHEWKRRKTLILTYRTIGSSLDFGSSGVTPLGLGSSPSRSTKEWLQQTKTIKLLF